MKAVPVVAVFDVGKTNKKFFLFDEKYAIVLERTVQFAEVTDEEGFSCDNVMQLQTWVMETLADVCTITRFNLKAVNFSAYGASFVYIGKEGNPIAPLFNYLKPFPAHLSQQFYGQYGSELAIATETASPVLGSLNSGLQIYRVKHEMPDLYEKTSLALHLPQFLSFLVTGKPSSDITSIGCHTQLWNFNTNTYHRWVTEEKIDEKLPPVFPSDKVIPYKCDGKTVMAGSGLHDSSAALIPYLTCFTEPFILISTGTWCITLNPFNSHPLTHEELEADCLCYMEYHGKPVKASRLFAGNEHEQQTKKFALHYNEPDSHYKKIKYDRAVIESLQSTEPFQPTHSNGLQESVFSQRNLSHYKTYEEAYH